MSAVRLGNNAKLIRGITFKPVDKCDPHDEGTVVCMRTKNVQATLDASDLIAVPRSLVRNSEKMLSTGDILVSSANSWNLVGKCCQVPKLQYPSTAGAFISILRPKTEKLESSYLYRWFSSDEIQRRLRSFANQTTNISNLNHKKTLELQIPLPALAEQKRIAGILDAADALRAKRREALAQLDTLLQATFLDMFGDPARSGWTMVTVEAVASSQSGAIRTGPFGSQLLHSEFVDEGIRVLGIDNAVANEFREGEPRFITAQKYEQLRRYTVRPRDVLITIMGTCGRCAVVPHGICTAINTKHLCCITLDRGRCLPEFMHAYFLEHPIARRYLERSAKGAIMSGLNMRIIKAVPIPAAPLDLQHRFAAIVQSVEQQKTSQRAHLAELDTLFASLQSRAFRGDL